MRRVVVTGLGAVTPLGVGKRPGKMCSLHPALLTYQGIRRSWTRLLEGHCGIVSVRDVNAQFASLPSQIAGVVPRGLGKDGFWHASDWLNAGVSNYDFYSEALTDTMLGRATNGYFRSICHGCLGRSAKRCKMEA